MSDYVEGEDNWKKVNHTNLSDAQADIAALQARVEEMQAGVAKAAETLNDMLHQDVPDFSNIDDVIFALETIAGTLPILVLEGSEHGSNTGE